MHTSYTVGVTTGEYKALTTVMIDQQGWVTNSLTNRARQATLDITRKYTQFKIEKGEAITAIGSTEIIEAAIAEGVVGLATDVSVGLTT